MNISQLKNIQTVLDEAVETQFLAGANVLIVKDDRELGYFQSGFADRENNAAYRRNTICRMYSMTKPVTSVAAMTLVEEGKLDLGTELGNYLPEFWNLQVCTESGRNAKPHKASRNILICDLLNMTSGYSYGAWWDGAPLGEHLTSDLIAELNESAAGKNNITTMEVARRLSKIPVIFEPGTDYQYGYSADILGAVIEKITGKKFSEYVAEKILKPLGMNDTAFYVPEDKQNRLAKVYRCIQKDNHKELELFTGCNLGIQDKMDKAPAFESGGAGLCSTVDDYMKFALMLTNGGELNGVRILQKSTVDYLSSARLSEKLQKRFDEKMEHLSGYSYSNLMRVAIDKGRCKALTENGEFGWDGWLGPYLSVDLKNQLAIVVTMQRTDSGLTTVTRRIKNIIYSSI